jgi:opacity protein-like surface antigen
MTGKFASASARRLLLFVSLMVTIQWLPQAHAQSAPANQAPAPAPATPAATAQQPAATPNAQQSGTEEVSIDEQPGAHRKKVHDYKNWTFDIGAGAHVDSGSTKTWVRGGGVGGTFGVARNANKYLGLRVDLLYDDLPLRQSTLALAQASSATTYALTVMAGPVINIPVTHLYSGYVVFGPGYVRRAGTLHGDTALPGSPCTPFWTWWEGTCPALSLPLNGSFTSTGQNEFAYNIGAGVARKMPSGVEVFAEYRLIHGSANGTTTDMRPVSVGVRW